ARCRGRARADRRGARSDGLPGGGRRGINRQLECARPEQGATMRKHAYRWAGAFETFVVEAVAGVGALALFCMFLLLLGSAPFAVIGDVFAGAFGSTFSLQNTLSRAAPLMLTALCTAVPGRVGLLIIGNEGALLLGALGAVTAAQWFAGAPAELLLVLMLVSGGALGAVWIFLSGFLRRERGVN